MIPGQRSGKGHIKWGFTDGLKPDFPWPSDSGRPANIRRRAEEDAQEILSTTHDMTSAEPRERLLGEPCRRFAPYIQRDMALL